MSYARFGYADVYVYMDFTGRLACCGCSLTDAWYFDSTDAMIAHLAEHRAAGHDMPSEIEAELRADDGENFPPTCREGHMWGEPFHPFPDSVLSGLQRVHCRDCEWETSWPKAAAPTREDGQR